MHIDKYKQDDGWYLSPDGISYEDAESYLSGHVMDFCGCGMPDAALKYVRDVLKLINIEGLEKYDQLDEFFGDNDGLRYTMLYLLDMKELTEHGGSVPGWLTQKGKEFLEDLEELYSDESEEKL